jgi:hypothetical protein
MHFRLEILRLHFEKNDKKGGWNNKPVLGEKKSK